MLIISLAGLSSTINNEKKSKIISNSLIFGYPEDSISKSLNEEILVKDSNNIESSNAIDAKVVYSSKDSMNFSIEKQMMYLYGNAEVTYKDIKLTAAYIEMDMGTKMIYANSVLDSTGKKIGKPVFTDASETFEAEEMYYNFNTRKGKIIGVRMKQGEGYLHGETIKKQEDNCIHVKSGKYTTCEHEHPHFYIKASKIKVIPNDKIITGPAYLVIEDIPVPLVVPFGFFPNSSGAKSGVVIPQYGESDVYGFYLNKGGFHFAINDRLNTTILGDIYTNGSFGLESQTNYKKRYKYNGSLRLTYAKFNTGESGLSNYQEKKAFSIAWKHNQDSKANPNSRFSANVKAGSESFNKYQSVSESDYLSNTFNSSISYQRSFFKNNLKLSTGLNHNQNTNTKIINISAPVITLGLSRQYPLKKYFEGNGGVTKMMKNLNFGATLNLNNSLKTTDSLFLESDFTDMKNGGQLIIPVSTSLKIAKYVNFTPRYRYSQRWYFSKMTKFYQDSILEREAVPHFYLVQNQQLDATLSTKIFGLFKFKNPIVKAIRHVITPSVSGTYVPENNFDHFEDSVLNINTGNYETYSILENGHYGLPGTSESGALNFSISNNLEMKVRNRKDTLKGERKIKLIENFRISSSYNHFKDSIKWSYIRMSGQTKLLKRVNLTYDGNIDPYVKKYDSVSKLYKTIDEFEWDVNNRIGRYLNSNWRTSVSLNLSPKTFIKRTEEKEEESENYNPYIKFEMPWSLNISYSLLYGGSYYYSGMYMQHRDSISTKVTQNLGANGHINLTKNWKIDFRADYDIKNKELSYARFGIERDLHCWQLNMTWVPFGYRRSYMISLRVKSSILQDLKLEKKSKWQDNIAF